MIKTDKDRMAKFQNRYGPWALVAGASQGLGAAYADQLAARGLNLFLIARRVELLDALADNFIKKYSIQVRTLVLDLSQMNAAEQIAENTVDLDIGLMIYNAGYSKVGIFLEHEVADHIKEINTNIRTVLIMTYLFGQRMMDKHHGGIILMSSLSAFQGSAFISNYGATKAYNMILAEGLWEEWRQYGVDVLACIAGAIRTPNYLASTPKKSGKISDNTLEPQIVVRETLAALGRQPYVIPGLSNRFYSTVMRHILPRRLAIQLMGRILRDMYVH